jgi:hypothetical protein
LRAGSILSPEVLLAPLTFAVAASRLVLRISDDTLVLASVGADALITVWLATVTLGHRSTEVAPPEPDDAPPKQPV